MDIHCPHWHIFVWSDNVFGAVSISPRLSNSSKLPRPFTFSRTCVFHNLFVSMHDWNCTDCILASSCFGASGCFHLQSLRFPCSFQACYTHFWVSFPRPRSKACSFIISDHAVSNTFMPTCLNVFFVWDGYPKHIICVGICCIGDVETNLNIKKPWNIYVWIFASQVMTRNIVHV